MRIRVVLMLRCLAIALVSVIPFHTNMPREARTSSIKRQYVQAATGHPKKDDIKAILVALSSNERMYP